MIKLRIGPRASRYKKNKAAFIGILVGTGNDMQLMKSRKQLRSLIIGRFKNHPIYS